MDRRGSMAAGAALLALLLAGGLNASQALADGDLNKVKHIIIVMQENHAFDNYFGALPTVPGGAYHNTQGNGACPAADHQCVDGLDCTRDLAGNFTCSNFNLGCTIDPATGATDCSKLVKVFSFHDRNYCPQPDLNHEWTGSHQEANFDDPNMTLQNSPNDGFVRVNDATEQTNGERDTMGFYTESDLPYYYALAQTFAIDDRYFCSLLGPTIPNRFYLMAATSFGHLLTNPDFLPPPGGYKPLTGTIFDLLDQAGVNWVDYFTDVPQGGDFRTVSLPHFQSLAAFFVAAAAGTLPQVAFVDPQLFGLNDNLATDEHPPHDIRSGQFHVARVIDAVRNGSNWQDSIIIVTYDEHGGSYDHVKPPRANQGDALTPDGIAPGLCADASNPNPGGGANCSASLGEAETLCPALIQTASNGTYPLQCATFNQLGFRVPFIAVSPFSKPRYVSHAVGDHASVLALIEKRFLSGRHLTLRDQFADTLEDMFDFDNAPSLATMIPTSLAAPPNLLTDGDGSCVNAVGSEIGP